MKMDNNAVITPRGAVMLAVSIIVVAAMVPTAIDDVFNANTTGWDASTVALWVLLPLLVIVGLLLVYIPGGGKGKGST